MVRVRRWAGGGWEVDIHWRSPDGRRRRERKRLSVSAKSVAQRWGEQRERELLIRGPAPKRKEVPTLSEFSPRFIDGHARANRHKPGGIRHKELMLRAHLLPQLGTKRLDAISTEDVQRLKHRLSGSQPKTINNVITVLNTLLKKAVEWEVIDAMPCTIRLLKVPERAMDFYDTDDFEALVAAAERYGANAYLVVLLGGEAGLRAGEMRALEWTDVNFHKGQLSVERSDSRGEVTSTKGNRVRYVPTTERLLAALRKHRHLRGPRVLCRADGRPFGEQSLKDLLVKVGRLANVRVKGPHMLRHTFCSSLAMKGAAARAIQELAGHRDLKTTQRYMHLSPSATTDAIRLLNGPGRGHIAETAHA